MSLSKSFSVCCRSGFVWHSLYFTRWPGRRLRSGGRAETPVGSADWYSKYRERLARPCHRTEPNEWSPFFTYPYTAPNLPRSSDPIDSSNNSQQCQPPEICVFAQVNSNSYICSLCGTVHICEVCRDGFACQSSVESTESLWVCPISARSFPSGPAGFDPRGSVPEGSESEDETGEGEWTGYPCCSLDRTVLASDHKRRRR